MKLKQVVAITVAASSVAIAGMSKINFFYYKAKYKNAAGLTRHKQYSIYTYDDAASQEWMGDLFMGTPGSKGYSVSLADGKEYIGLLTKGDDLRGLWVKSNNYENTPFGVVKTRPTYSTLNSISRMNAAHPNLHDVQNVAGCPDGAIAVQSGSDWTLVSGQLSIPYASLGKWSGVTTAKEVGVAMICNTSAPASVVTLNRRGDLKIWKNDLSEYESIPLDADEGTEFLSFKSDGIPDQSGVIDFWAQTATTTNGVRSFGIQYILYNTLTGSFIGSRNYTLHLPGTVDQSKSYGALSQWIDFVPFYVGSGEVRILAISKERVHVFSGQGEWIDSPVGSPIPASGPFQKWRPSGMFFHASAIMTSNNKRNWSNKYDIYVADDFSAGEGHGIHRFQWSPDGFSDYVALDVRMKDVAGPGERMSKPVIQIENTSLTRQLNDAKIRLWLSRSELYPQQIVADKYWINSDGAQLEAGCSADNPNLCWVDIVLGDEFSLDPGEATTIDGIQLGIHGESWGDWNRSNDPSWVGIGAVFKTNPNVTVYTRVVAGAEWGKIWGNVPSPSAVNLPYGWVPGPPPVDNSASLILGFESDGGWYASQDGAISYDYSTLAQGAASLRVDYSGWVQLESKAFPIVGTANTLNFDLRQAAPIGNPWWKGQVQVYIEAPSRGVYNQWIGQVNLSDIPDDQWKNVSLPIPTWVVSSLGADVTKDCKLKICVNRPEGSGPVYLDDCRLVQQ